MNELIPLIDESTATDSTGKLIIQTKCENCIFASIGYHSQQKGCKLDRLEKFEQNGAKLELPTLEYPHFIIKDRYCAARRTKEWAEGKDDNNLGYVVRAELLQRVEIYLYFTDYDNEFYDKLDYTIKSIKQQILKPGLLSLVCNQDGLKYSKLIKFMEQNYKLNWRIDRLLKDKDGNRLKDLECIDDTAKKCMSQFYVQIKNGYEFTEDFFANIDEAINEKLMRFCLILPDAFDPRRSGVYSIDVHNKFFGNSPIYASLIDEECTDDDLILNTLSEKIHYFAKKDNAEYMIKNYEEICQ